jgi:hypothetical protein
MSFMFEVYYKAPADKKREAVLADRIESFGGRLDYREEPDKGQGTVCLTFEFDQLDRAEAAAETLRQSGEHVEGPVDYGD